MSKIILNPVASLLDATTAAITINTNSAVTQTAFDNTLSRDGTSPNQMNASLDMNSNSIINLPAPVSGSSPLRLTDASVLNGGGSIPTIPAGGTTGQALKKTSNADFATNWGNDVTSVGLSLPADYTVTNSPVTSSGTLTATFVNTPTGSGGFVRSNAPTLVTPTLGVATATSINKVVFTQPTSSATLTIADSKTVTHNSTQTFAGTDGTTLTFQGSDTYVGRATTDTLTNKTIDTAGPNTLKVNGNAFTATAGSGTITVPNSTGTLLSTAGSTLSLTHTNPTGTTSLTGVMMGLGDTWKITPAFSTRIFVSVGGAIANNTIADGAVAQMRWSTGSAPANGAALTGPAGNTATMTGCTANTGYPFMVSGILTALTPGTQYWLDLSLQAITGGTATLLNLFIIAFEV